ncbi:hypothetical protein Hanom_Chr08g00689211 [Helianthus anomalus]
MINRGNESSLKYPFFERSTNPQNGLLTKFTTLGYTRLPNRENSHPAPRAREHSPEGMTVR